MQKMRELLLRRAEVNYAFANIYKREGRGANMIKWLAERAALNYCAANERGTAVEVIKDVLGRDAEKAYKQFMKTAEYLAAIDAIEPDY